jgi:conjugal transfer pilus assembly protein TraB
VGRPDAPPVVVEDSPDYLPPNAPARVIVGVDASAGVASQTDPLPVVLGSPALLVRSCRTGRF